MITHEFPPGRGGIGTYASQLARGAQELGHEMTVVAPDFGRELAASDRSDYPFEVVRYRAHRYSCRQLAAVIWRAWRWSRRRRYDVLHAVDSAYVMALAFLNKLSKVSFVATVYGSDILSMPSSKQARLLRVPGLFERADQVFAISRFTRDLLLTRCPRIPPERVLVTPLGVDPRWFELAMSVGTVLEKHSVPESRRIVFTVARLDERKVHWIVLRGIAKKDPQLKRNLSYVVVGGYGNTAYFRELNELAASCGARVRFTGDIPDEELHALYAAADIYCMPGEAHPRKVEGFGLAYLEAAAQRTPSIASRVGGAPEAVLHEQTGILIDPGDDAALCAALTRLLTDESCREQLGNGAYERAKSLDWKKCAGMTYGE